MARSKIERAKRLGSPGLTQGYGSEWEMRFAQTDPAQASLVLLNSPYHCKDCRYWFGLDPQGRVCRSTDQKRPCHLRWILNHKPRSKPSKRHPNGKPDMPPLSGGHRACDKYELLKDARPEPHPELAPQDYEPEDDENVPADLNTEGLKDMSNEIADRSENSVNPWAEFARREGADTPQGEFLGFKKGVWSKSGIEVPEGTQFEAIINNAALQWQKWLDRKLANSKPAHFISDGMDQVESREAIEDLDESGWPYDRSGKQKDPWQLQVLLPLLDQHGGQVVFSSASAGGRQAVAKLGNAYRREAYKHPGANPIIAISSTSYDHEVYGEIQKPVFNIVGWTATPEGFTPPAPLADFNDEIPY